MTAQDPPAAAPRLEHRTPWHKDKRLWCTWILFAVITFNGLLHLGLSEHQEWMLFALVSAFIGQSQLGEVFKLRALAGQGDQP